MNTTERFLKYVTFDTQSDEGSDTCPSTSKQLIFADYLAGQLAEIGIKDAFRDANGYVYGHIPASAGCENAPVIGLISHMDTSPDVSGKNVKPRIITYDGSNAPMTDSKYIGKPLIVSDRTTLLGADDKAGIAEIISACERVISDSSLKHGGISICFTPDEEIGRGSDNFDHKRFAADFAYTVDGGELGNIDNENFNAAGVTVKTAGVNTHPGSAKNKMRNALLYLNEFVSMLPAEQAPGNTEGAEGFYHLTDMSGDVSSAEAHLLIRDFDSKSFEERKRLVCRIGEFLNQKYGERTVLVDVEDSYYNMNDIISDHPEILERAQMAFRKVGIEPVTSSIRGGTDGARLSFEGLPCPNLSTGGMNFHSIYEAVSVEALEKMTDVLVEIVLAE